jgi:phytoene dehydrogenase-like protein
VTGQADPDVVVIGAGPNGLTAAVLLARAGLHVLVLEANERIGGGAHTAEVTLPGFRHDLCSAFFPLGRAGPLGGLPLEQYGVQWCDWARSYGGATPNGRGIAITTGQLDVSAESFDASEPGDGRAWRELYAAWRWAGPAFQSLLFNPLAHPAPLVNGLGLVRQPGRLLEFAQLAAGSAQSIVERYFRGEDARIWFTGSVYHSDLSPHDAAGGGFGLLLCGLAQQLGMPVPRGGAQAIPDALARMLAACGGTIRTGERVERLVVRDGRVAAVRTAGQEIAVRQAVVATVEPQALFLDLIDGGHLPPHFVQQVRRFRWGTGVFQMNLALAGLPTFRAEALNGTLAFHLGRGLDAVTRGVVDARQGLLPEHPVLVAGIQTLADPTRAPDGQHTLWLMTHVPSRIRGDAGGRIASRSWSEVEPQFSERILATLEEHAPGLRTLVRATHAQTPEDLERGNANLVGGDIGSGSYQLDQQLVFRPVPGWFRYQTPIGGLYMAGASTHPGGGVHGAAGSNAARTVLLDLGLGSPAGRALHLGSVAGRRLARAGAQLGGPRSDQNPRVAAEGVGPLLQHEAWMVVRDVSPEAVIASARQHFAQLATQPYARFRRDQDAQRPLAPGDRLHVSMPLAGTFELEVVAVEASSMTFRTRGDHPEAGRVTVAAEAQSNDRVRVSVRTRTRANGWRNRLLYATGGSALQARLWHAFLERLASATTAQVIEDVHARTEQVADDSSDRRALPTAVGPVHSGR